jgi:hypothetical protein
LNKFKIQFFSPQVWSRDPLRVDEMDSSARELRELESALGSVRGLLRAERSAQGSLLVGLRDPGGGGGSGSNGVGAPLGPAPPSAGAAPGDGRRDRPQSGKPRRPGSAANRSAAASAGSRAAGRRR